MWTLSHPDLPATAQRVGHAVIGLLDAPGADVSFAEIDPLAGLTSPVQISSVIPTTLALGGVDTSTGTTSLDLAGLGLQEMEAIALYGLLLSPVDSPEELTPGTFYWDADTETATVSVPEQGRSPSTPVTLFASKRPSDQEGIPTDYISDAGIAALRGLPITGTIDWTLSLEQHPSGSMQLLTNDSGIDAVSSRLRVGTEITIFGIGFSVSSFDADLQEDGIYEISVSLTGKWAREKYNRASKLRRQGQTTGEASEAGEVDPDCGLNPDQIPSSANLARHVSAQELGSQIGVVLQMGGATASVGARGGSSLGKNLSSALGLARGTGSARPSREEVPPWHMEIPPDAPANAVATWSEVIEAWKLICQSYLDYTSPGAVRVRNVSASPTYRYVVPKMSFSYKGDTQRSPGVIGYATQYINMQLTGRFSEPEETPGKSELRNLKPRWLRQESKKISIRSGDSHPESPPAYTNSCKTLSLNWDASGPTKTDRLTTSEDGSPVEEEEWIWGFAYTGDSMTLNEATGELYASPGASWRVVTYKKKTYLYDPRYGYALGYDSVGWRLGRFAQESDGNPETRYIAANQKARYLFQRLPLIERCRYLLKLYNNYYNDTQEEPAWVDYKSCNRDGTSTIKAMPNRNWAPAYFVSEERTYTNSFATMPNPANEGVENTDTLKPPLVTGEESDVHVTRQILPSKGTRYRYGESTLGFDLPVDGTPTDDDRYLEWRKEDSSQGPEFKDKAVRESFTETYGRPSPASRKAIKYELKEPESEDGDEDQKKPKFRDEYYISTPGWSFSDPSNGSLSYGAAETLDQARTAARTALLMADISQSAQFDFVVPFSAHLRPMDKVRVRCRQRRFATRLTSIKNGINIEGMVGGRLILTAKDTEVSAGIDRVIPTGLTKRRVPIPDETSKDPLKSLYSQTNVVSIELGTLIDEKLKTRRNF